MGSGMQRFRTVVAEQDSGDRRYDTVLFDLYGTLVDIRTDEDDPEAWETLRDFLDEAGAHYDSADQLRDRFMGARALSSAVPVGHDPAFYEPDLLPTYRAMFSLRGMRVGERLSRKAAWVFRHASTRLIWLYPGALDMLKLLKGRGLRVVLLSNAQSCYTRPELTMLEMRMTSSTTSSSPARSMSGNPARSSSPAHWTAPEPPPTGPSWWATTKATTSWAPAMPASMASICAPASPRIRIRWSRRPPYCH